MSQYNDCQLAFYQANGATADSLQDAKRERLILEGFSPQHNQDMFFIYLKANGYVGAYSDMKTQFWKDQGCMSA